MRALIVALALSAAVAIPAQAATRSAAVCSYMTRPAEQMKIVEGATGTMHHLRDDRGFAYAAALLQRSKAVLIIPNMVKAGFIIGGEGGDGVVLVRKGIHWSNPAFYSMGAATFGLQAGVEGAELVLFIMSDRALASIMQDEFKINASAGLAILNVGSNAHATSEDYYRGDIVVWSKAGGLYAGMTLNGSTIRQRHNWNNNYYGRDHVTVNDILVNNVCNFSAQDLRLSLHW